VKLSEIDNILNKYQIDKLIHAGLCFIAVKYNFATIPAVIFVCLMVEYLQKYSIWNYRKSWRDYLFYISSWDMIANTLGIITGSLV